MLPPLRFVPLIKRLRWGGTRLGHVLGKNIGQVVDAAESWEIVDHGGDQSEVIAGEFQGWKLSELVARFRAELLGPTSKQTTFPLLVKYLDAHDRLSLQVHPNDEQAGRYVPGERGKTESWVILEARPGSLIYAGLKPGVDRSDLHSAISQGKLVECVHSFQARAGDCVHIPAGTVHAIGEGVLLVEIQQTCDITFRLHDWDRVGTDGKPRQLHIQEALECVNFAQGAVQPITPPTRASDDAEIEELVSCPYFQIKRHSGRRPWLLQVKKRFHILNVLEGQAILTTDGVREALQHGDTILIPASCDDCEVVPQGNCVVLETTGG